MLENVGKNLIYLYFQAKSSLRSCLCCISGEILSPLKSMGFCQQTSMGLGFHSHCILLYNVYNTLEGEVQNHTASGKQVSDLPVKKQLTV